MISLSRRRVLRRAVAACGSLMATYTFAACRRPIVEVERIIQVEKEVTKIITEVVRETVLVLETPDVEADTVERVETSAPSSKANVVVVADVLRYGWTELAKHMTPTFQETFPQVTMQWRTLSDWRGHAQRIAALEASGDLGDLIDAPAGTLMASWSRQNLIRPLGDLISGEGFDTSGIFPVAMSVCRYQDQQLGLPFVAHPSESLLVYDEGAFRRSGTEMPRADWSLTHLVSAASDLSRPPTAGLAGGQYGYILAQNLPSAYPLLHLFGGALLSEEGTQCRAEQEGAVACLEWMSSLAHRLKLSPDPAGVARGSLSMFYSGQVPMIRESLWTLVRLRRANTLSPNVEAVAFPRHPETGKRGTLAASVAYCISRGSKVAEQAFQWMRFMSSREMGAQMILGGYAEPGCRMASWTDPRVLETYPICAQLSGLMMDAEAERLPWNMRTPECLKAWNSHTADLLAGVISPRECADRICADASSALALSPTWGEGDFESGPPS